MSVRPLLWSSERILAGVIRCDESEALVVVEPLDGPCGHLCSPTGMCTARRGGRCEATTAETRGTAVVQRTLDGEDHSSASPRGVGRGARRGSPFTTRDDPVSGTSRDSVAGAPGPPKSAPSMSESRAMRQGVCGLRIIGSQGKARAMIGRRPVSGASLDALARREHKPFEIVARLLRRCLIRLDRVRASSERIVETAEINLLPALPLPRGKRAGLGSSRRRSLRTSRESDQRRRQRLRIARRERA